MAKSRQAHESMNGGLSWRGELGALNAVSLRLRRLRRLLRIAASYALQSLALSGTVRLSLQASSTKVDLNFLMLGSSKNSSRVKRS